MIASIIRFAGLVLVGCSVALAQNLAEVKYNPDLSCYQCEQKFKGEFYSNSTCLAQGLQTALHPSPCGLHHRYCMVEKTVSYGRIVKIARGCVEECIYGCKFIGLGLTYEICTSCCRGHGCNTGNGGSAFSGQLVWLSYIVTALSAVTACSLQTSVKW